MLKPKNTIDVVDFNTFHNLLMAYFSHIQQLSLHWKHSKHIVPNKINATRLPWIDEKIKPSMLVLSSQNIDLFIKLFLKHQITIDLQWVF
jgi:hypothetical protein